MAIIDVVTWNGGPGILAWKYPSSELSSWTQLIVSESQEAVMLREGKMVGPFLAGRHVLSSDNYPVLHTLLKIPFGRSPYTAEVWFVQKALKLDIRWGTSVPLQLEDPKYHIIMPLKAFGQYGITVEDATFFLGKLVGTLPEFTQNTLSEYFRGIIITHAKDLLAKYVVSKNTSILEMPTKLLEISEYLEEHISPYFAEFGLRMQNFTVSSLATDDADPAVKKLKGALAARAEMDIMGYNYQQKRSFDTLEKAAGNPGGQNGLMGAGIGLGMGFGMGGAMGSLSEQMSHNLAISGVLCPSCGASSGNNAKFCSNCGKTFMQEAESQNMITCDKCGTKIAAGAKFCPQCGDSFRLCPNCNTDNPDNASVCRKCGSELPAPCHACGKDIPAGCQFCPACGAKLTDVCPQCGKNTAKNSKFCTHCGTKIS